MIAVSGYDIFSMVLMVYAVAESFWATLKRECLPACGAFTTRSEGIKVIERWISYYNGFRPHSALGMKSPYQYRGQHKL